VYRSWASAGHWSPTTRAALKTALDTLAATTSKTGAARATRAAVLSYNRHVDDLQQLGAKLERERRRLEGTL
jgi:hypothetical protein